jgi:hypothetical protein
MSNVTLGTTSPNNSNTLNLNQDHKGSISPVIKPIVSANPNEKKTQQNDAMSWSQVGLRGLYGAAACGIYLVGQRTIFQQPLNLKDLGIVTSTCGLKAMVMSTAIKGIREGYRKFIPDNKNQLPKDITEAGIVDALETGVTYFQEKATAKDVDFAKILGLSALKSYPNNFMDTQSYSNFVNWYSGKEKLSENPLDDEKKAFKQRKVSFENYVISPLAALVTAIPATYLNNEPFTPTNFAKTVALRVATVKLWRKAMDLAKAHSGDAKPDEVISQTHSKPIDIPIEKPVFPFKEKPIEV